jgi:plasmid stabilization system protein ParE
MFHVIVTGPAKQDIQIAYDWWASNRSGEQANRRYNGIYSAIESLSNMPERCSLATESEFSTTAFDSSHMELGGGGLTVFFLASIVILRRFPS